MRRGLCTLYDQSPSALCLGNPVARDLHVVIGRTLAGSTRAVQSCLCSLSPINVARGLSAASCESLQWAIWVNHCSAYQSRDPDAAMPIGICESWLLNLPVGVISTTSALINKMNPGYLPLTATALKPQQVPMFLHISARVWERRWSPHTSEQKASTLKPQ